MQLGLGDVQEIRFTVIKGSNPGAKISFEPTPRTIRIGRSADNDLVVADATVSRQHAHVDIRDDGYSIKDAGSSSGLEKMGFRVGREPEPLQSGDELRLGDTILRFEVVAKKGAIKRVAAKESEKESGPPKPSPLTNVLAVFRRALSTMGLRSGRMQIIAAACFLVLVYVGLQPEPPTIAPQAADLLSIDYDGVWGYNEYDVSHAGGAVFQLPSDADGVGVYLRLLAGDGVEIHAGDRIATSIAAAGDWQSIHVLVLPRAIAADGVPTLKFDHLGYSAEMGPVPPDAVSGWGIGKMRIVRVTGGASSPSRVEEDLASMRELYGRLEDNPRHRYEMIVGLRRAMVGLMKLAGRPAVAYSLPISTGGRLDAQLDSALLEIRERRLDRAVDRLLPALQTADVDLTREYTKLANNLELMKRKESTAEIAQILPKILKLIPDPTDVRHRDALELSRTLWGDDLATFEGLMGEE